MTGWREGGMAGSGGKMRGSAGAGGAARWRVDVTDWDERRNEWPAGGRRHAGVWRGIVRGKGNGRVATERRGKERGGEVLCESDGPVFRAEGLLGDSEALHRALEQWKVKVREKGTGRGIGAAKI